MSDEFADYLDNFATSLKKEGVRITVDHSDNRMQQKIRDHTLDRVPFMVLAGARDVEAETVAFRFRDGNQRNDIPLEEARQIIQDAISNKEQV